MGKNCLKQILTYINKVYDVGEKINSLKNKNKSPVKISTIAFIVLLGFTLQIRSFNRLKRLLKKIGSKSYCQRIQKCPTSMPLGDPLVISI